MFLSKTPSFFLKNTPFSFSRPALPYLQSFNKTQIAALHKFRLDPDHPLQGELTMENLKEKVTPSFEDFSQHPYVQETYKDKPEEMRKAYESFCRSEILRYTHIIEGNNPVNIL